MTTTKEIHYEYLFSSDPNNGALNVSDTGSTFFVQYDTPIFVPPNKIGAPTIQCVDATIRHTTPNVSTLAGPTHRAAITFHGDGPLLVNVEVTFERGLYSVQEIEQAMWDAMESTGNLPVSAGGNAANLFEITVNQATGKARVVTRYQGIRIYIASAFPITPLTAGEANIFDLLGFAGDPDIQTTVFPAVVTPIIEVRQAFTASATGTLSQIESYHVHCDLVDDGMRINNTYDSTVANVFIDVEPQAQIQFRPFFPPTSTATSIVGQGRTNVRCWLTDEKGNLVDCNGETWSFRLRLVYELPFSV